MFHLVDDTPEVLDSLHDLIEYAGYKSMRFDSAESYLEHFNTSEFAAPVAIITDYEMPGLSGLAMIKQVREKLPLQKAVVISGTPREELNGALETYLCYSLPKPYKVEKLFSMLEALSQCEKDYQPEPINFQPGCQYGLEHACPFQPG
ncbi:MAG: response regulator [Mariprofundaceae bacterium]